MRYQAPGRFKTIDDFRARWRAVAGPHHDLAEPLLGPDGPLARPFTVHDRTIGNRFAVHPMEGWDGTTGGAPTDFTLRRWRRFGRSGAKLVWGGEAFAVHHDGRANPNQLFLNDTRDVEADLLTLRGEVLAGHREVDLDPADLFIGLQLTHSGRFSRPDERGAVPRPAHTHPTLAAKYGHGTKVVPLSDDELNTLAGRFVRAATLARDAGFDFVDVKCCHGYLLHEMLGARSRPGRYGGDFAGRTALFRQIVEGIRSACPDLIIAVRVSIVDTVPYITDPADGIGVPHPLGLATPYRDGFGVDPDDPTRFDLDEPLQFIDLLDELGITLVNLTIGSPYYCPHIQRPAAYPPSDGYQPPEDPLRGVALHLDVTRRCKLARPNMRFVGSGYSYLQEFLPHVAEHEVGAGHVDAVGLGRMTLSYPELPRDVLAGRELARKLICRTFSDCTTAPRHGLISGCYPLDSHYRDLPQATELRVIKKGART